MEDAIALAARAHRGQQYSSPEAEPYIFHPLRVMLCLADPIEQVAAVLHDAIEDTELELSDLVGAGYSPEVVAAVDRLTHRAEESYEEQGFTKTETFAVAEWRGQVFERRAG